MNPWDLIKAFGRGVRWMFVGMRNRETDISYKLNSHTLSPQNTGTSADTGYTRTVHLPIAEQFRRSKFLPTDYEEGAGLISHAQANPYQPKTGQFNDGPYYKGRSPGQYTPARERYDPHTGAEIKTGGAGQRAYDSSSLNRMYSEEDIGVVTSTGESEPDEGASMPATAHPYAPQGVSGQVRAQRPHVVRPLDSPHSVAAHQMQWAQNPSQGQDSSGEGGAVGHARPYGMEL
jgi:hypothetical protein